MDKKITGPEMIGTFLDQLSDSGLSTMECRAVSLGVLSQVCEQCDELHDVDKGMFFRGSIIVLVKLAKIRGYINADFQAELNNEL